LYVAPLGKKRGWKRKSHKPMLDPVHGDISTIVLAIGVLLGTGPVFAGLVRVAKANGASSSWGTRLLLASVSCIGVGIAGYITQNSFEKGSLLDVLDTACLFVSLFGFVLMFVGLAITVFESIKMAVKQKQFRSGRSQKSPTAPPPG